MPANPEMPEPFKRFSWIAAVLLGLAACGGNTADTRSVDDLTAATANEAGTEAVDPPERVSSDSGATEAIEPDEPDEPDVPIEIVPVGPFYEFRLRVVGEEELIFDWTTDRCADDAIPDIAPRAFRSPDGLVNLTIGHWDAYRMVGSSLDDLVSDCSGPLLSSDYDPDPAMFNDSEWLASVYTPDGETYYGIAHNEYRGDTHDAARPGQCPSDERLPCLDTSFTHLVSVDGGRTFDHIAEPPGHLVATLPYQYRDDTVPSGIRQPSNIVDGRDGYWYLFGNISDQPAEEQWVCAMRTDDLSDPRAWRFWDGRGFEGVFVDPYATPGDPEAEKCAPYARDKIGDSVSESIVYDESIGRFVLIGPSFHPVGPEPQWGFYAATSSDLVTWSTREFLLAVPITPTISTCDDLQYAYPSLIDPDSESPNFETTDGDFYLYLSRFNFGGCSLDRDVVRWRVAFEEVPLPAPDWSFDTDGDAQGWVADGDLGPASVAGGLLTAVSTGEDPVLILAETTIPSDVDRLVVRMRLTGPSRSTSQAQLFWGTSLDSRFTEQASILFDVTVDGEWRDYVVDLSAETLWDDTITSLRLDPLFDSNTMIDIDRIVFVER